ncbi:hypothetical protein [Nocardia yunnanensis]|nr:hypothetical protein [Nocardia yunnanensis]
MELLIIVALVILVGAVVLFKRRTGRPTDPDFTTGNPPSSNRKDI